MKAPYIKHKARLIVSLIILIILASLISYKLVKRFDMVNRQVYNNYSRDLSANLTQFKSTEDVLNYIRDWGSRQGLTSTTDESGNVIFQKPATAGMENRATTVVCVDIDYLSMHSNLADISTAQYIAAAQNDENLKGGPLNVIFLNNDKDLNYGANNLSASYIPEGSNVFYLSDNLETYSSRTSFARAVSKINIKAATEPRTCDTMLKIKIGGIPTSASIGDNQIPQPDIVSQLQALLTKLRSKSTEFQIYNISLSNNGNLEPTGMEVDLLINQYDLETLKKWIEERSEKFIKNHKKIFKDVTYTVEVVNDPAALPTTVYNSDSIKSLSNILYTINNGYYKFNDEVKNNTANKNLSAYGINAITQINPHDSSIDINIVTDAYDDKFLSQIINENSTAASIFNATHEVESRIASFDNKSDKLTHMLAKAYTKVNLLTDRNIKISEEWDEQFTTCSYLNSKNSNLNIIHIAISRNEGVNIANVLLNYHRWPNGKWI